MGTDHDLMMSELKTVVCPQSFLYRLDGDSGLATRLNEVLLFIELRYYP
ncbi:hypothetical protein J2W43_000656 [Pseudomonas brassicacearum]|uniref:Transposase n=1 Tax=Pseudomonas brassicacearum TaxID=930166 RepID=A0AAW8M5K2_9PSED|nr:hypothetical protein [Pseudomonas brassicacearum]